MTLHGIASTLPDLPIAHAEFERHAAEHPDRLAVTHGAQRISYGELDGIANQLAQFLLARGIGKGSVVGLCLDRTPELIQWILAVLKTGAAYVPLDTTYPAERLQTSISQLPSMSLIAVSAETVDLLGEHSIETLSIADHCAEIDAAPSNRPDVAIDQNDLCYVVFTSGSTGTPKAVAVRHLGWYNLMSWQRIEYRLDERSSSLIVSSFGFDITQRAIMTPLFCGAPLHLLASRSFDPAMAYRLLAEHGVRTVHCTPSTLYLLVDRETERSTTSLRDNVRFVFIGGEALSVARITTWATIDGNACTLLHQYGVSECTDVATSHQLIDFPAYATGLVPVGKPVYNTTIHLLDEHLDDAPEGEIGEVCISGASVGAGYLNARPADAARFTSIVRDGETIRIYRTGDRGGVTPDGELFISGRMDAQVKIRGSRIDLGDVDRAVRSSSQVRDAAVIAVDNADGELELVAFAIPADSHIDVRELRSELYAKVPKSMVPSEFVEVPAFPLSPNGKVDRKALSACATVPAR